MESLLVSIIIPVYNAEKYLNRCLDSVLAQTYTNWECLLIDDGSNDSSGKTCDEYASKDSRFRVFHKENGGVSVARNLGILESKGEYICFLDSDDMMTESHLKTCTDKIGNTDLLIFSFERWNYRTDKMILPNMNINGTQNCHDFLYELKENGQTSEFFCFPWNKLYKRSLLVDNNILFPTDISLREDEIFSYRYLPFVHDLNTISDILIKYNDAPSGLSAKKIQPVKAEALAHYLMEQTKQNCSNKSKSILFFRAMVYLEDAIINSKSYKNKIEIAQKMFQYDTKRSFSLSPETCVGKARILLLRTLASRSVFMVLIMASITRLKQLYRLYIIKDENFIRWGTNV